MVDFARNGEEERLPTLEEIAHAAAEEQTERLEKLARERVALYRKNAIATARQVYLLGLYVAICTASICLKLDGISQLSWLVTLACIWAPALTVAFLSWRAARALEAVE